MRIILSAEHTVEGSARIVAAPADLRGFFAGLARSLREQGKNSDRFSSRRQMSCTARSDRMT